MPCTSIVHLRCMASLRDSVGTRCATYPSRDFHCTFSRFQRGKIK